MPQSTPKPPADTTPPNQKKPAPIGNKPGAAGSKPGPAGNKPGPAGSKPGPAGNKPGPAGNKPGPGGNKPGPNAGKKPAGPAAARGPATASLLPPARGAKLELRHKILALSFVLVVIVPTLVSGWYLYTRAEDQYISTVAFTVRQKEGPSTIDVLGGLTQFTGGGGASDTDIIYDYLRSQDIVTKVDQQTDLRGKFSKAWPQDWVYAFDPEGTIEDLTEYWRKQVVVLYDVSTKLITVEVGAYTAADARDIAIAIFEESSRIINSLSDIAREDATKYAREELIQAQDRLTKARQALTEFRTKTQIVDPSADLAGQMGVLNALQTQLVEALISLDQLAGSAPPNDPRVVQSEKKVAAIRARIAQERAKFGSGGESPMGESYAELMSDYEGLAAQKEFAETTFISAQAAFVAALAEAQRQSRYLAAHIRPALAEASLKPDRPMTILSIFGFAFLGWSIMLLVYYSIRDRR